jgi:hypothetical protein
MPLPYGHGSETLPEPRVSKRLLIFLNHHFGRLDDDADGVTLFQSQFFRAGTGDDALDQAAAYFDDDMGHDVAELNVFYFARKLIPR